MKRAFATALAGILVCSSSGLTFADEVQKPTLSDSASGTRAPAVQTGEKTRAQVRAEMKASKPTSAQHDRDIMQSVTGMSAISRTRTSP